MFVVHRIKMITKFIKKSHFNEYLIEIMNVMEI